MSTDAARSDALPPCVCGGTSYARLRGPFVSVDGIAFEVRACGDCGLARTSPPPYADELDAEIYQQLPYESMLAREGKWRGFFAPMLGAARRHRAGGRLLDIGCGGGLLVRMAEEAGYEAWGLEINARSAAHARDVLGLRVVNADLAAAAFPDAHFAVITLSHVFEHLIDPAEVLREVTRVLEPDGVLVIEVPNMAGLQVRLLGGGWPGWVPNMHVWQFTPASLADTLARLGYEVVELRCHDNIDIGDPVHPLKRLVRRTALRAVEHVAVRLNRADKILCVARPVRASSA